MEAWETGAQALRLTDSHCMSLAEDGSLGPKAQFANRRNMMIQGFKNLSFSFGPEVT